MAKRASNPRNVEGASVQPPIAQYDRFSLPWLLEHMGTTKEKMRDLLRDLDLTNAELAYNFLRSQDRIPTDLDLEKFIPLYNQILN